MVFTPLSLAVFALASAAVISDNQPEEDQIFTSYYPVATTTVHVGSPISTTAAASSAAPTIPAEWLRYGVEFAAIQWANYRKVGVSHQDAVKLVRDGINLYVQQPAISELINGAYGYFSENSEGLKNKNVTLPADFCLNAIRSFQVANEKLIQSPGFADVDKYLKTNLRSFDVGESISDLQHLVEINPALAHKGLAKAHDKINSSPENFQAYEEAIALITGFAKKYNVQGEVVQAGINNMLNVLL